MVGDIKAIIKVDLVENRVNKKVEKLTEIQDLNFFSHLKKFFEYFLYLIGLS